MFSQLDFFPKSFPGLTLVLSCHKTFDSQTSQALGLGSIPIARSIKPVDAVGFTGFHSRNWRIKYAVLDAVGRGVFRSYFVRSDGSGGPLCTVRSHLFILSLGA